MKRFALAVFTLLVLCKAHSKTNLTLNANENLIEQSVAAAVLNKMINGTTID